MNKKQLLKSTALSLLFVSTGCQEYTSRYDSISPHLGDTQAVNRVLQTEDQWALHTHDTHIHSDGQRMSKAVQAYKQGGSSSSANTNTTSTSGTSSAVSE